jgi:formamidopyrimidine-DNA glycosylase
MRPGNVPELPEVETYKNQLRPCLVGRRFTETTVYWSRSIARPEVGIFPGRLTGQQIRELDRRGKYLVFVLSDDTMLIHLKMSGRLDLVSEAKPQDPHARVVFHLDDGHELRFHDPRKFGRVHLVSDASEVVGRLGPEPLSDDFTPEILDRLLVRRKGRLKSLLLNQEFVAGLGNIYADEVLHRAGLHPLRPAGNLTLQERARLYAAIREVLGESIAVQGTTFEGANPHITPRGEPGDYQPRVYNRTDQPCPACGTPIRRIVVGQRGTHFCPTCQPFK